MTLSTSPLRTVPLARPAQAIPAMTIGVPDGWAPTPPTDGVIGGFIDHGGLSSAYRSNVLLTALELPAEVDLEEWQSTVRDEQLATLPDLQILDDRPLRLGEGGEAPWTWYRASTMTDRNGATVLTRRWNRRVPGLGVTLTLTTLPLLDAEHGALFDAIADSWTLVPTSQEERHHAHA